jgi:hypothetical protein
VTAVETEAREAQVTLGIKQAVWLPIYMLGDRSGFVTVT